MLFQTESALPLHESHAAVLSIDEVAPQRVDYHEDQLIEWCFWWFLPMRSYFIIPSKLLILRQPWHKGFVWEEASREDQDRDRDQEVRDR
jgi:hypothetical protein